MDITKPCYPELLAKARGSTALPVLETEDGHIIKESLVLLRYLEDYFPGRPVAQADPYWRTVETMLITTLGEPAAAGYRLVTNQDLRKRIRLMRGCDSPRSLV